MFTFGFIRLQIHVFCAAIRTLERKPRKATGYRSMTVSRQNNISRWLFVLTQIFLMRNCLKGVGMNDHSDDRSIKYTLLVKLFAE